MFTVAYNMSSTLKEELADSEVLRKKILLTPTSPQTELAMRWQGTLAHLEGWASLSNQPLTKPAIIEIIRQFHSQSSSPIADKVVSYRNALNFIRESWPANPATITFAHLQELAGILGVNPGSETEVQSMLGYVQSGQVHPLIQAATVHLFFYPSRLAYLVSLLFLTKSNYDLHGWLSLEDYWSQNKPEYLQALQQATHLANTTLWLEYFSRGVIVQMGKISTTLTAALTTPLAKSAFRRLTVRQKGILAILEKPDLSMSNKVVQSTFGVSQITASRDLSKLVTLGQLVVHGSGRSTYYTRV